MFLVLCVVGCSLLSGCQALYDHTDEVYDLNPDNFQKLVIDSHFVWIVEFYAPWSVEIIVYIVRDRKKIIAGNYSRQVWALSCISSRVQEGISGSQGS